MNHSDKDIEHLMDHPRDPEELRDDELNNADNEEIGRLISQGFTSGILDRDGFRISWKLTTDIFEN